jgi:hypothetical protein
MTFFRVCQFFGLLELFLVALHADREQIVLGHFGNPIHIVIVVSSAEGNPISLRLHQALLKYLKQPHHKWVSLD